MANVRHVLELAKSLSATDRALVARDLLATLDYPGGDVSTEAADSAWRAEARRRTDGVVSGDVQGTAAEDVHARIERDLDKHK